jgi:signal transduction histidine kinase
MTRHAPRQNGLLAALPSADFERLSGSLELVPLPLGRAVYESGGQLDYAYFPTDCIVSLLSVTRDGSSAEIAIAGNEGLVGIALFMGGETTSSRAVVQNAGYAYRVPAALIKQEFNRGGALQLLLLRYTQALITQMSQTAVCNRHHSLEQQLCRWLLLSVDRLPSNRLEMTEELIANMLGVPGAGVAAAAAALQVDGLIQYNRGAITVLDRARLEQRVCECYAVVKREFERLLHLPGRSEALQLSGFIEQHMDEIVAEWEAFAHTLLPAAATMTSLALRDHAKPILQAIAKEIQSDRAGASPLDKSAATTHGALRHLSGFNLLQLGSEYGALRASVIKLWRSHLAQEHHGALDDLTRFNEAVDQALAESIASYAEELARSRDTFLAILGHDLRSPLTAVAMSGHYLSRAGLHGGQQEVRALARIQRGAAKMDAMIRDLLEYTRTRLGRGVPIVPEACNIGRICEAAIEEMRSGHPERAFLLRISGDLDGSFDGARLEQVIGNLLNNAVQHGAGDSAVILEAHGESGTVSVRVTNHGSPITADALQVIFNPLVQVPSPADERGSTSLGLGLFIARSIVEGHGGTLEVESSAAGGTVFTARLPRG